MDIPQNSLCLVKVDLDLFVYIIIRALRAIFRNIKKDSFLNLISGFVC